MELREMRVFVAIAETGGLSSAARRLHLSQPAVSHTVGAIERELGVQLLVRTRTGVELTEIGATLLTEARAVLARYEQAIATVTESGPSGTTELRIGVPLELPHELLSAPLASLAAEFPATKIRARHLSTSAQLAALRAGELDVGLLRERPIGPDLDAVGFTRESLGVLVSDDIAEQLSGADGIPLESLAGLDWVGFPRSGSPAWFDQLTAILRGHGIEIGSGVPDDQLLLPELKMVTVATGTAFAFAPPDWPPPLSPGITWCPLVGHPVIRRTWVVWPANSRRRDLGHFIASIQIGFDR
ncbi:MAG TPA: LysR family transcriptional regulator [Pseudonocardia sp.]|jgi:DNA-binding transcriptional LysR family regulator|nr:LysR family transcriptional regulator [Pseudonocardia sp.]